MICLNFPGYIATRDADYFAPIYILLALFLHRMHYASTCLFGNHPQVTMLVSGDGE